MNDYTKLNEAALRFIGTMEYAPCDVVARLIYGRSECGTAWKTLSESGQLEHWHKRNGRAINGVSGLRLTTPALKRLGLPESRSGPMSQATLMRANAAVAFCHGDHEFHALRVEAAEAASALGITASDNVAWCVSEDCCWRLYVAETSVTKIVTTIRETADKLCVDDATRAFVNSGLLGLGVMVPSHGAAVAVRDALKERAVGVPVGHLIRTRVVVYPTADNLAQWLKDWREGGAS